MEIRCKKQDCRHNTGCSCRAGHITVDRAHHCASYEKDALKQDIIDNNGDIFSVSDKRAPNHLRNVPLDCKAKSCLYNRQEQCSADGISVIDCNDGDPQDDFADCATYCVL